AHFQIFLECLGTSILSFLSKVFLFLLFKQLNPLAFMYFASSSITQRDKVIPENNKYSTPSSQTT
ncbi:MAG: hypothetical protein V3V18_01240, partial [Methylococcales bacterium]